MVIDPGGFRVTLDQWFLFIISALHLIRVVVKEVIDLFKK